jgi:hypothetical protein
VVGPVPAGFSLLPGVLHPYRASAQDLPRYVAPVDHDRHHGHGHDPDRGHDRDRKR